MEVGWHAHNVPAEVESNFLISCSTYLQTKGREKANPTVSKMGVLHNNICSWLELSIAKLTDDIGLVVLDPGDII
jgi:hypothetical protein